MNGYYTAAEDPISRELYNFGEKEECTAAYMITMLNRTQQIFEYENLPDSIPKRALELLLQINGYACIAKHDGELYAFYGGLGGEPDPYYMPTICTVSNPALKLSKTYKIGDDCVIVNNDTMYLGLMPIFRKYATALTENDISFDVATKNTRILGIISTPDDNTKKAADRYLEDVESGKLASLVSNEFLDGLKVQPLAQANMRTLTQLIEYQQYLKASWYNDIGLNANYNMKRESLTTTEVQMNFDALLPLIDDMLECRKLAIEKVNAMFGTNISVSLSSAWEKVKAVSNAEIDDLNSKEDEIETKKDGEENVNDSERSENSTDTDSGIQENADE